MNSEFLGFYFRYGVVFFLSIVFDIMGVGLFCVYKGGLKEDSGK